VTKVETDTDPVTLVPIVRLETARVLVTMPGMMLIGKVPPEIVDTFSCLVCKVLVAVRIPFTLTLMVDEGLRKDASLYIFIVDATILIVEPATISTALDDITRTLKGENMARVDGMPPPPPKLIRL
jgi:hypothetical protein